MPSNEWLFITVGAILVNNVVLSRILGICPFLGGQTVGLVVHKKKPSLTVNDEKVNDTLNRKPLPAQHPSELLVLGKRIGGEKEVEALLTNDLLCVKDLLEQLTVKEALQLLYVDQLGFVFG